MANLIVGVSGSIAAFKAPTLVRELIARGHAVRVVMTAAAARFVGPITFTGLTGVPPLIDVWDPAHEGEAHVELAAWGDLLVVAPATANLLARAAHGIADDALTATLLCFEGPRLFAPAMHHRMWDQPATRRNVARLESDGARLVGPFAGPLASGDRGMGRMAEPLDIAEACLAQLAPADLAGRCVLVSAGGTLEDLDPVRFLGNRSTGRMGYAIAERAAARGARALLVSAPTSLAAPPGVERIDVRSAREMEAAVTAHRDACDAIVMAAAVADYRPKAAAEHKIKKTEGPLVLELERNPDILAGLGAWRAGRGGGAPILVGFALETKDVVASARKKLEKKKVDLVVGNQASESFGREDNRVTLVGPDEERALEVMPKRAVADHLLDWIAERLRQPG